MTKEEAKDLLDNLLGMVEDNQDNDYDTALRMGIKALEQEPCEDAVSREAVQKVAVDVIAKYIPILIGRFEKIPLELVRAIRDLPPVKPVACIAEIKFSKEYMQKLVNEKIKEITAELEERKWIPVKERLPEESLNSVIGWDAYRERCVFVQYINGYFQITGSDESFNIVAWMPLPDDYKEEKESE